jgi:hypothetical protein
VRLIKSNYLSRVFGQASWASLLMAYHLLEGWVRRQQGCTGEGKWVAAGFNGHGMDKSWLTGERLATMMIDNAVPSGFHTAYLIDKQRLAAMKPEMLLQRSSL